MLQQLLTQQPQALLPIVRGTPSWVWTLLLVLIGLGASQMRGRRVSLRRSLLMPAAMVGLSLYGLLSAFAAAGHLATTFAIWLVAVAVVAFACLNWLPPTPSGARYDSSSRSFTLPGSAIPLLLMLGIFFIKYAVGIELAMAPATAQQAGFAAAVALLYGLFNGFFIARAARLLRLTRSQNTAYAAF